MENDLALRDLYRVWMRILNKLSESEKLPRNYGTTDLMTLSDVHVLQAVGNYPESNVRTIADILGVTPGAASQQLSKLTKRGLVTKVRGIKNEKEVFLNLTSLGSNVYRNHETVHEMVYQRIITRIGPINNVEIQILHRVLHAIESVYDERIEEVSKNPSMYDIVQSGSDFSEKLV
jgi:DNA-binding MarR family transcriptional regulator